MDGKFISDNALAAVGNSYEITLIFIAFAFGCNIACSVLAALFFGAKQYNDLKTTVYTALISSCVICAVLMLVGTLCCDSLLRLIKTPEEVFADSKLYLDIYIYGLPFVFLYNVATGIFSALGDSKTPFLFLACSSTSNIAVDILFVTAFNMGVAGVAWATFLCQGVSCVLALVVVFRRFAKIPTEGRVRVFSWNHFGRFAVIAIPSILQQSFISVGNIIIQSVINSFGAAVMAGYSAAVKLNNMVITSLTTLGNGISNYTAQNLGASKYDRIKSGFRAGIKPSPAEAGPGSIFVKTEYRLRQIELDKILYIEGLKDYVKIYVEDEPRPVLSLISLKTLEEQLPAERFVRVHRSYIVQPSKIRIIERGRIVFGKTYIPVSDGYKEAFYAFLEARSLMPKSDK